MKTPTSRPVVLCLSGHDPSGGAGLQADIEALLAQGCHAAPAVTALTVQDTVNVSDFRVLDREWVLAQANAVLADLPVAAVKLGMLGSLEMVDTVAEILAAHPHLPVVCDPVDHGQGIDLTLAGAAEDFRRQLALAPEVAVQAAGGDPRVVGQGLHGQRGETALRDTPQA